MVETKTLVVSLYRCKYILNSSCDKSISHRSTNQNIVGQNIKTLVHICNRSFTRVKKVKVRTKTVGVCQICREVVENRTVTAITVAFALHTFELTLLIIIDYNSITNMCCDVSIFTQRLFVICIDHAWYFVYTFGN